MSEKTMGNTDSNGTKKNVKDVKFWGKGDVFKLISKASSQAENWMKSTKAMEISGAGCLVQVSTQQGDNPAEAVVVFVPNIRIEEIYENENEGLSAAEPPFELITRQKQYRYEWSMNKIKESTSSKDCKILVVGSCDGVLEYFLNKEGYKDVFYS